MEVGAARHSNRGHMTSLPAACANPSERLRPPMAQPPPIAEPLKDEAWHNRSAEEVLAQLGTSTTGLSAQEAAQRFAADGPNELKEGRWISSFHVLREPHPSHLLPRDGLSGIDRVGGLLAVQA